MSTATGTTGQGRWFKSSYSNGSGGECVEVRFADADAAVRDSKLPDGPRMAVAGNAWGRFVGALRAGLFR
ncbi:DUF397 domain-containing protein [Streptomyces sp. NPDC057445]|uniref:DUF397 domain-containing protein n=1 Tax=Streptomyces sp. NPDC057445 TaxID=3346136 RepID=UPI0036C9C44C